MGEENKGGDLLLLLFVYFDRCYLGMGSYNYYKMFGFLNRKFKISEREPPPDVRDAFSLYAGNGPHMNAEQLARFLVEYQGEEGRTADDAAEIIQQIHDRRQHLAKHNHLYLDLDGFFEFLFQDDLNGPLNTQVPSSIFAKFCFSSYHFLQ